jgi:hypothetical protein
MKYFAAMLVTAMCVAAGDLVAKEPTADDYEKLLHIMGSEVLKRIAPPFPESRLAYYREKEPGQADAISRPPSTFYFRWKDGEISRWGMSFSGKQGASLTTTLRMLTKLYPQEIVGDESLQEMNIPGDFVVNVDASKEAIVGRMQEILNKELMANVVLEFRDVEREVYVARGKFLHTPIAERGKRVEIYGERLNKNPSFGGGGAGDLNELLNWVGMWIEQPVVDDVATPPKQRISWHYNLDSPYTDEEQRKAKDPALVLKHLTEQTGLTFTKEKRKIRLLALERKKDTGK